MNRLSYLLLPFSLIILFALTAAGAPDSSTTEDQIHFVPFSHLDLFWGGLREEDLARGCQIISKAVRMGKASPEFRFLIEDNVMLANFVESHRNSPELDDLKR